MDDRLEFNNLLADRGIDTKRSRVLVMRHAPSKERELREALPQLAANQPDVFNAYQQAQNPRQEKQLEKAVYLASFVGCKAGEAVFVGLYEVVGHTAIPYDEFCRKNKELHQLGMRFGASESVYRPSTMWFDLRLTGRCADWKSKLIIVWPAKEINWSRWAHQNKFEVKEICEHTAFTKSLA
jgi:hypothetical protein